MSCGSSVTKETPGFKATAVITDNSFKEINLTDYSGIGSIQYSLIADITKNISGDYGILVDDSVALRGLFLIDKDGIVRHSVINDLSLGRSVSEAIRVLDALQYTEKHGEVCPADWSEGDDAMKPDADGVANYLSKHN